MHASNPASADTKIGNGAATGSLRIFVFALFFIFGAITSLNDVLIPKLKQLFSLSYGEAMLTQSAFFAAYFIMSLPAGLLVRKFGYMRSAVVGLAIMLTGCLLFIPASTSALFGTFLAALFVLAVGITVVQVVANPLISMLGSPGTAHSRLTFAQAFNSLGTTIAPYVGATLILGALSTVDMASLSGEALAAYRVAETAVIVNTYVGIAAALGGVALLVWFQRDKLVEAPAEDLNLSNALGLLRRPRFALGALSIFLYVGAEVAIGSLMVSYLTMPDTMALTPRAAGEHVALYWGGAMVGRFVGAGLLRIFPPGKVLACAGITAVALVLTSANSTGAVAGWTLLLVGLCNSIMFPTIFSLASEGLGSRAAEGSGLICMAIVGGAVLPPLTGLLADHAGLATALVIPGLCYVWIAGFGWYARRDAPPLDAAAPPVAAV